MTSGSEAKREILCGIRHDEEITLQDGVGANRDIARRFANAEANLSLKNWRVSSMKLTSAMGALHTSAATWVISSKAGSRGVSRTP